ncbi:hypothetical protein [Paraburkholderia sp.]|uniref:hypothetical protein n=1 Tax=Paraburkholderia sp. TaxID=1926495 RepID=UPI003C7AC728
MNSTTNYEAWTARRVWATGLALAATSASTIISVIAGWNRGGEPVERASWILIGVVLLLAAHLIPTLTRGVAMTFRWWSLVLWFFAMLATGYGHATFFLVAQSHAGEVRASTVTDVASPAPVQEGVPGRDLVSISAERAKLERELAWVSVQKCRDACDALQVRRIGLRSRMDALKVEFDQAKRREAAADQLATERAKLEAKRDAAESDPVTLLIARVVGTTAGTVNLVVALFMGWLLEGIGCLAWLLAIPKGESRPTREQEGGSWEPSTPIAAVEGDEAHGSRFVASAETGQSDFARDARDDSPPLGSAAAVQVPDDKVIEQAGGAETYQPGSVASEATVDLDLERLKTGINRGEARATVASIRQYFRCSQTRASELRRAFITDSLQSL